MRTFSLLTVSAAVLSAVVLAPADAQAAGCYRFGETGHHWYSYCAGPSFLYPHQRVCRNGHCWYR